VNRAIRAIRALLSLLLLASLCPPALLAQAADAELQLVMSEARRLFDALEYEQAVPTLNRAIGLLQLRQGDEAKRTLAEALEIRARCRFGLGDQEGARQDFIDLLRADPAHVLPSQVSPRAVAIFDDAKKTTVTTLRLTVSPSDATVLLDGARVAAAAGERVVLVGNHTLSASRNGYKSETRTVTAVAETVAEAEILMERSSAVLSIVTAPADVEVFVDGVSRGKTVAAPLSGDVAARAAAAGIVAADTPGTMTLSDVGRGSHRIEFRRGCFVQAERRQEVSQLDDYAIEPIKLTPAVATVVASVPQGAATVFVDGESKGPAPYTTDLCEGPHVVELRSQTGRFMRRVDARVGQRVEVSGLLRPAFALVASSKTSLNADLRSSIERAFEPLRSILVFAPQSESLESVLNVEKLPSDWLGYDANRRPFGVAAEVTAAMRRELSSGLARAFDAQGIAAVTAPTPSNRSRLVLTLLAAGSAEPDVIEVNLEQPETVARAVADVDRTLSFFTPAIGLSAVDVADVAGAVVVSTDPSGPAAAAGLQVGDLIVSADGQAVGDAAALAAAVAARGAGQSLSLSVRDRAGSPKSVNVNVLSRPRLLGVSDQTLLVNKTVVTLRARLSEAKDSAEQSIIRLNLATALVRLESWSEARTELQQVKLPDGPGVGTGTVQYLLGLCASRLGNRPEAETAFQAAAASNSLLTEDGPPVKELAEARLAELRRR
jgi:tetratricopeptide (TPR) repeat protein